MDWIKFESPKQLSVAVKYVRNNVYFLENRSAQKLGLYDIRDIVSLCNIGGDIIDRRY